MRDISFTDYLAYEFKWKEKQRRTNMTIQGARIELINMLNDKNLPLYYEPSLKKVIETIEQEYDVLNKIRAEITEYKNDKVIHLERNEMIDIVIDIIDKYRGEQP